MRRVLLALALVLAAVPASASTITIPYLLSTVIPDNFSPAPPLSLEVGDDFNTGLFHAAAPRGGGFIGLSTADPNLSNFLAALADPLARVFFRFGDDALEISRAGWSTGDVIGLETILNDGRADTGGVLLRNGGLITIGDQPSRTPTPSAQTPEPATLTLVGIGLGIAALRRRSTACPQ